MKEEMFKRVVEFHDLDRSEWIAVFCVFVLMWNNRTYELFAPWICLFLFLSWGGVRYLFDENRRSYWGRIYKGIAFILMAYVVFRNVIVDWGFR